MAEDREVLREIWNGRIPICFALAKDEVHRDQPEPFYSYVSPDYQDNEVWLEDQGAPLKWHYPVGVLFDLVGGEQKLPWNVTVHFQNFPESELLRCSGKDSIESMFMAVLKEADSLKHRGDVVTNMQKKDHKQLWLGLMNEKFDQFWSVNKKLMEKVDDKPFNYIPFRVHTEDKPYIQKLFKSRSEDGTMTTVDDFIKEILPEVYTESKKLISHGVAIHPDTNLQWLSEHFSYPDNFLHFCVVSAG